jgi:hypothetical protein
MGPVPCLGAYARIERPGRVALGDEIYLEGEKTTPGVVVGDAIAP